MGSATELRPISEYLALELGVSANSGKNISHKTYCVCIDDFSNGNIDHWLCECHQVGILVNIKLILQFWDFARSLEKAPRKTKRISPIARSPRAHHKSHAL